MALVAFDTQQVVEDLEKAGVLTSHARAISFVIRKSHEAVDVATKRDLDDLHRDIDARFGKTDTAIAEVRKDLSAAIAEVRKDMDVQFEQVDKRFDQSEKRFDKLESKFDRIQWFLYAATLGLLFKEQITRLLGI
ncbi:DUF1640 domain-containing protein [Candidatus Fukatsuia symbiotica]|uniref:DUF1640 domain-containing protein n=1 Tax=Candidatus Fukatsuia symbiotica TaxID=1878942 RepID=A0A2U8I3Q9_9GAMM|nr:hypothetical protein [Candidatus Fukatsuia symbiotica]AWK13772.1 hypothetical protein CCS41_03625 [Candidatus Fukatsuia symbiotica]MEA9445956.1 DUF1640 domain-containing protein [Candidatus Fukatsuia symbiotica]